MNEVRAWMRPNGNVVVNVADDPMFFQVSRDQDVIGLTGSNELPFDAEPLVRNADLQKLKDERTHLWGHINEVTDALEDVDDASESIGEGVRSVVTRLKALNEALNDPYSSLNQQAGAWQSIKDHPLIGSISTLPVRGTYAESVKARLDAIAVEVAEAQSPPTLPLPDAENPKHFRFAARLHELADISFAAYQQLMREAERLEAEQTERATRDALVEEMARAGYEAVDEVLANGDSSRLHHWDSFTQGKEHHRIIARALLDDPRFKIERVEDES